jgi:hypothetical protein
VVFSEGKPEWTVEFGGGASGQPVSFGDAEGARGLLVAEPAGRITLISPQGEKRLSMTLDYRLETQAVAADLHGHGKLSVVAVDERGSIYCFDEAGQRQWKFGRCGKSGEIRLPVVADLDGDGRKEILVPDSQGHLDVLDADGKLRLEITATKYRVGVPAVGDVNGDGKAEIIFGTDAGEVYCVSGQGELQWATTLDACFGRALPLIADAGRDGNYQVYFPTAFNSAHPGLFALEAATGRQLWQAPSVLQSYRSTVVADLEGDGRNEILFGDKNSSLFCLDSGGRQRWTRQLDGRGIFFAPAVAALQGNGASTILAVVRGAGSTGKSLYALDATGKVVDSVALPGGGGASPVLCRFQGQPDLRLSIISGSSRLLCYRLEQKAAASKILWPGVRNDAQNSGFIKSAMAAGGRRPGPKPPEVAAIKKRAVAGTNKLEVPQAVPGAELVSVETLLPDHSRGLELLHLQGPAKGLKTAFVASAPGDYDVTVRWPEAPGDLTARTEHYVYHLDQNFSADADRLEEVASALRALGRAAPGLSDLSEHFLATARAALEYARRTKAAADFDAFHWKCDYYGSLAGYCRSNRVPGGLLVHQLANPWENFDAVEFFSQAPRAMNSISVSMVGNEYESVAVALTNLRPYPAVVRLSCGPFQGENNQVEAKHILEFREVLKVRPDGIGEPVEDALPRLGEAQIVRLEPGETRKLWLTFRSQALLAGTWRAKLKVGNITAAEAPAEVPVTIEVSTVRLPARFTYRECNWLYLDGIRDEALQEATLRDALEHGMNVFCIPGVSIQVDAQGTLGPASTAAHDRLVRKLADRAFFLVSGPISVQWPAQAHPDAALQQKTFAEALRWYADHIRSLGIDYEDYAIYLQDEPGLMGRDANFEAFVARVKQFKAAQPRLQLYANPAGGARADLLRPLQDLIDVWAPDLHLVREQPEELKQIFQHGKHYWHYEAPADQRTLDPLGFYRMKPWVAFQMGMTGGGYWVYSQSDYWLADGSGGSEYGSVYPTDRGPVTTKRWEASRDGIQDFELLWLLRQTAEQSPLPARQRALALLDLALRFVTRGQEKVTDISRHVRPYTPDYEQWMQYRRDLIRAQEHLAETNR